jgi:hypothetical protein
MCTSLLRGLSSRFPFYSPSSLSTLADMFRSPTATVLLPSPLEQEPVRKTSTLVPRWWKVKDYWPKKKVQGHSIIVRGKRRCGHVVAVSYTHEDLPILCRRLLGALCTTARGGSFSIMWRALASRSSHGRCPRLGKHARYWWIAAKSGSSKARSPALPCSTNYDAEKKQCESHAAIVK